VAKEKGEKRSHGHTPGLGTKRPGEEGGGTVENDRSLYEREGKGVAGKYLRKRKRGTPRAGGERGTMFWEKATGKVKPEIKKRSFEETQRNPGTVAKGHGYFSLSRPV